MYMYKPLLKFNRATIQTISGFSYIMSSLPIPEIFQLQIYINADTVNLRITSLRGWKIMQNQVVLAVVYCSNAAVGAWEIV